MIFEEMKNFLSRLPKTDLHIHLLGAVRPETLVALSNKYKVPLPTDAVGRFYEYSGFSEFLNLLRIAALALREEEDFTRVAYEVLEDAHLRNCRHLELSFNPSVFLEQGVSYTTVVDGLVAGIRAAQKDFNISSLLIPSIDRERDARTALKMVETVISYRCNEVAGVGMDFAEGKGPPEKFADAYQLARKEGLKRTAHVCEDNQTLQLAPPVNFATCLDMLECDRVDHGYNLLADPLAVVAARERGTHFCVTIKTAKKSNLDNRLKAVTLMQDAGLRINIGTDDPYLHHTDLNDSWISQFEHSGWGIREAREIALNGVDACWLTDKEKVALRASFERDIDKAILELWPTLQPAYLT